MVIEAMRERMGLGLVMGDHPSIAGRSKALARRSINVEGTKGKRARGATKQDPNEGVVSSRVERTEYALGLTTRRGYSNGVTRGVLESTAPTLTLYIGDST